MIFTFIKSMVLLKWASFRGYRTLCNPREEAERYDQCKVCPFHDRGTCTKCGCLLVSKIMLATEQCPDKRWLRIWRKRATTK